MPGVVGETEVACGLTTIAGQFLAVHLQETAEWACQPASERGCEERTGLHPNAVGSASQDHARSSTSCTLLASVLPVVVGRPGRHAPQQKRRSPTTPQNDAGLRSEPMSEP